jgi:hypothetical protein
MENTGSTMQIIISKRIPFRLLESALRGEVIHSRCRQMHKVAASIPYWPINHIEVPTTNFNYTREGIELERGRTYVTPDWGDVPGMSSPNEGVDKVYHADDDQVQNCRGTRKAFRSNWSWQEHKE